MPVCNSVSPQLAFPPIPAGPINFLKRWLIPSFASKQDKKVTNCFILAFQEFLKNEKDSYQVSNLKHLITSAESLIRNGHSIFLGGVQKKARGWNTIH
jgi:hypothetical protein